MKLYTNSEIKYTSNIQPQSSCECYLCGSCTLCIIFAPLVGAALGVALGAGLAGQQAG